MIISLSVLVVCIIGSTYALYKAQLSKNLGVNTTTHGLAYYINYVKGTDITAATLNPSTTYEGGASSDIEFWKKDDSYDIYGAIKLTINTIGTNLSNSPAIKYAVVNNGEILSQGSLKGRTSESEIYILYNLYLEQTKQIYTVYVWLDNSEELGDISDEELSISIDCDASLTPATAQEQILGLYYWATKSTVTNNNITYNIAPLVSLIDDSLGGISISSPDSNLSLGNLRYYGSNPNNYIYFNCEKYPNTNCELWRIIGVFDGKLKLTRNESIGSLAWDYDKNDDSSKTTYDNDWSTSTLQKLLNEKYYNGDKFGDVTYYGNGSTTSLNLQNVGIKNDITRNMISNSTWYLGGHDSNLVYSNGMYEFERGTKKCSTCTYDTTWTGKIALIYPSDYGYAASFGNGDTTLCSTTLSSYNNAACKENNWIYWRTVNNNTYNSEYMLTPNSESSGKMVWHKDAFGSLYTGSQYVGTSAAKSVFPTLYLNSTVSILKGIGTETNPYQLIP